MKLTQKHKDLEINQLQKMKVNQNLFWLLINYSVMCTKIYGMKDLNIFWIENKAISFFYM